MYRIPFLDGELRPMVAKGPEFYCKYQQNQLVLLILLLELTATLKRSTVSLRVLKQNVSSICHVDDYENKAFRYRRSWDQWRWMLMSCDK